MRSPTERPTSSPAARAPRAVPAAVAVLLGAAALTSWPARSTPPSPGPKAAAAQPTAAAVRGRAGAPGRAASGERSEARGGQPASPTCAQGVRGKVLDAAGFPVDGAWVHLTEALDARPGLLALAPAQPHLLAPVASAEVAHDGTFALGMGAVDGHAFELCVVSERHAPLRVSPLRLLGGRWHDLGPLTLEDGATVRGRVTFADRPGLGVPNAQVTLTSGGAFAKAALAALPGGDAARTARCDASGYYEVLHAPPRGIAQLVASAPGLAQVRARDIELRADRPVRVDLALPAGAQLFGVARTRTGAPVAGARVEVTSGRDGAPAHVATTDDQGAFRVEGLHLAPQRVRLTARGYATVEREGVNPSAPLALTLTPQHRVRVTVRTPGGAVARSYRLALRRFFPADPRAPLRAAADGDIGAVPGLPAQHVRLDNATDGRELAGVPGGLFVCEVHASGWARSFSAPLSLPALDRAPGEVREVEVTLSRGSALTGVVRDARGRPIAGATVTTWPAGTVPQSPVLRALQRSRRTRATRAATTTDAAGRFTLQRLSYARYQLQVEHPDACPARVDDIDCKTLYKSDLGDILLGDGALVYGAATLAGRIAGQIRVILTSPSAAPADRSLRLETVTDPEGRFAFDRRIPPGSYLLHAAPVGSSTPDSEIFHQLLQRDRSSMTLRIAAGEETVERHLDLPAK